MSESTSQSVECPLCGELFDPAVAGGWCTNSECGEWQYDGEIGASSDEADTSDEDSTDDVSDSSLFGDEGSDETSDPASESDDPSLDLGDEQAPDGTARADSAAARDGAEDDADAETDDLEVESADEATPDEADAEWDPSGEGDHEEELGESDTVETADAESETAELELNDTDSDTVETADAESETAEATAEEGGATESKDDAAELGTCPSCGTDVEPSDAFCPGCGDDLDAHRASDDEDDAVLDACPECGSDVDPSDAFCASCGENLDAHRGDDEDDELGACPSCGTDVEPSDAFCPGCGDDLDAHRAGGDNASETRASGSAPSTLALRAFGSSVVVGDDESVGREIRKLLTDAGRNEDEARRIHREHVRFVRENGQFHVVDNGKNPTELNGVRMTKGEKKPVGPGDELGLSDVVTLSVERP
jgi:uncharacterized OB-fold protein